MQILTLVSTNLKVGEGEMYMEFVPESAPGGQVHYLTFLIST